MRSGRACEMKRALAALIALLLALSGCAAKEATVAETSEMPTVMAETPAIAETPPAPAAEKEPEAAAEQEAPPAVPEQKAEREETPAAPEQEEASAALEETADTDVVPTEEAELQEQSSTVGETEMQDISLSIAGQPLTVEWEDNASVDALRELLESGPLSVQLSQYGGFEQVGALGTSLPRNDVRTTTEPGDIVLYSGNQIVIFYGSNSWAYTRLGRITGMSGEELSALLGVENVTAVLSNAEG